MIKYQSLTLATPQLLIVALANHPPAGIILMGAQVRDLDQHGGDQVDTLKQLEVDVHVERHLARLFNLLLLLTSLILLMLSLGQEALG